MKQIHVQSAGLTDTGLVRTDNQDQFFVANLARSMSVQSSSLGIEEASHLFGGPIGQLFMVADGMGGHRAGKEASALAIQFFLNSVLNNTNWSTSVHRENESAFIDNLRAMLLDAHEMIRSQSTQNVDLAGMGTTLTMAYVCWPRMVVVHAGDTRCYIHRESELHLLTRDHTVANQMIQAGRLDPNALERSPWSNVLINALGAGADEIFADIYNHELLDGDSILLCSDGLNKHVDDQSINGILNKAPDAETACQNLVDAANQAGGSDNTTVVVAKFEVNKEPSLRMKIIASDPSKERVLADFVRPVRELDTMLEDGKETADFPDGPESTEDFDS